MALRDAVLAEVAHADQMTIWTGEILGTLFVAGYMSDDMEYHDVIDAHEKLAEEIRSIIGHVVDVLVEAGNVTEGSGCPHLSAYR